MCASVATLADLGAITVFLRLHPLLPVDFEAFARSGTLVRHGDTVSIDLALDEAEIWSHIRSSHRQDIVAARRCGVVAYIDEHWTHFAQFVNIYRQTMKRVLADAYYIFPDEYFWGLRDALGDRLHLSIVEVDGCVACAGIVTEVGGIVQVQLAGTSDDYLKWSPNKMRLDFLRTWAKARGNRFLHLGGGLGGCNDSLFEFNRGFSSQTEALHTWRAVVDDRRFRDIMAQWESVHRSTAEWLNWFFPPYRMPP
jgi:hypothetical protein